MRFKSFYPKLETKTQRCDWLRETHPTCTAINVQLFLLFFVLMYFSACIVQQEQYGVIFRENTNYYRFDVRDMSGRKIGCTLCAITAE